MIEKVVVTLRAPHPVSGMAAVDVVVRAAWGGESLFEWTGVELKAPNSDGNHSDEWRLIAITKAVERR